VQWKKTSKMFSIWCGELLKLPRKTSLLSYCTDYEFEFCIIRLWNKFYVFCLEFLTWNDFLRQTDRMESQFCILQFWEVREDKKEKGWGYEGEGMRI